MEEEEEEEVYTPRSAHRGYSPQPVYFRYVLTFFDVSTTYPGTYSISDYPDSLYSGDSFILLIYFHPLNSGYKNDNLVIVSNDSDSPHSISLNGQGD